VWFGFWLINKVILQTRMDKIVELYIDMVFQHFSATVGLAFATITSLCLILLLRYSAGPIEFEGLGFKFKGASGPIVLWIFCYLVMVSSIKLLW
ncbi:hypothetical protein VU12_14045, partial [Desulfobulbus sp. US4]|nr:hypothetical protein [Desulfobulbus sp. US4]